MLSDQQPLATLATGMRRWPFALFLLFKGVASSFLMRLRFHCYKTLSRNYGCHGLTMGVALEGATLKGFI